MLNSEIKEAVVSKIMCLLVCQVVRRYLENVLVKIVCLVMYSFKFTQAQQKTVVSAAAAHALCFKMDK